jgi:hypothetical protein
VSVRNMLRHSICRGVLVTLHIKTGRITWNRELCPGRHSSTSEASGLSLLVRPQSPTVGHVNEASLKYINGLPRNVAIECGQYRPDITEVEQHRSRNCGRSELRVRELRKLRLAPLLSKQVAVQQYAEVFR